MLLLPCWWAATPLLRVPGFLLNLVCRRLLCAFYVHACVHVCVHVLERVCMCVGVYACACVHVCTCMSAGVCMHM